MNQFFSIPEELIEIKAHQIWEKRQLDGREGNSQSDWEEAKHYLEDHPIQVLLWKIIKILSDKPIRRLAIWWETTPIRNFSKRLI